jgi:2',3'-cyclic-nucleotide 2'-phosphodiesterase/3'-nucleotidase
VLLACGAAASADTTRVTLLHTTDLHGSVMAWDYVLDRPAERGLAKLSSLITSIRSEENPTIVVDAGDALGGGIETFRRPGIDQGVDPVIAAMNTIGYDAFIPGNHEFDHGARALEWLEREAHAPWLAANVTRTKGRALFQPSIVVAAGPLRVGIVGVTTPATTRFLPAATVAEFRFDDPVAGARAEVERLRREQACDVVVLVAHTGLARDPATGAERGGDAPGENQGEALAAIPGVDVLVLGHSHFAIDSLVLDGALVTQAGAHGTHLGRVDLTFTREDVANPWRLSARRARRIAVTAWNAEDPAVARTARSTHDALRAALARSAGRAPAAIHAPRGRLDHGSAWELIHRAQLWATGAEVSLAALPSPEVSLPPGEITERDLLSLYPYDNGLEVLDLSGADLRAALEWSARYFATYDFTPGAPVVAPGMPGYAFDSAAGIDYVLDLTRPPGQRVVQLTLQGLPLAPERRLRVAVNSYRANGGNGYDMLRSAKRLSPTPTSDARRALKRAGIRGVPQVRTAIATYLASGSWDGTSSPNWRLLPSYLDLPERDALDRLVRVRAIPAESLAWMPADAPARASDFAGWLVRSFGQAPPPLTDPLTLESATSAIETAAGAVLALPDDSTRGAFRRGLVHQTSLAALGDRARGAPLTRAQAVALIANARFPWIRVLETTDFHGAILGGTTDREHNRPIGSSVALASWINHLRAANPEGTVLIDGGDLFQGTMISNFQFGAPVVEQMNALGYAASAIGNHEFDWSADTLARRISEMNFAALGANVRERKTGRMPAWARADTVVVRRGIRIGILGLCYRNTPSVTLTKHVAHLEFRDDSTEAAERIPGLRARSDLVLGVGHVPCTSNRDRHARGGDLVRLARGVGGVAAWFGGHSHNVVVDQMDGLPIAVAGSHGRFVAVCDSRTFGRIHCRLIRFGSNASSAGIAMSRRSPPIRSGAMPAICCATATASQRSAIWSPPRFAPRLAPTSPSRTAADCAPTYWPARSRAARSSKSCRSTTASTP